MTLTSGTSALLTGRRTYFSASGGTEPYTYSVVAGGAGGSINASTGLYVAPSSQTDDVQKFHDTVMAEDSLGATITAQILVGPPIMLLCDIIQREMGLSSGQVYVYNQKINIPEDSKLYIAVGILSVKPFGSSGRQSSSDSGLDNVQSVNCLAQISIDILSRGTQARDRKEEVLLALNSQYAESQMEVNSFYIARLSTAFLNISEVDGAAIPYRFNITVNMQYFFTKTKDVPFYDTFDVAEVTTES